MTKVKREGLLLAAILAATFVGQPARAGFPQGDAVTLGGEPVMRMAAAAGYGAEHRAWMAQDALDNALVLAHDRSAASLTTARENGAVVLLLDGRRVATVDSESARLAGLTVDNLAASWSDSIQRFLSDPEKTASYVDTLKRDNEVRGSVSILERRVYAPAGMTFPITLTTNIGGQVRSGDLVEAVVQKDVALGHYIIPAGSVVIGEIVEKEHDNFSLRFTSMRTEKGTVVPIEAFVVDSYVLASKPAHTVCTYAIPSGMANGSPLVSGRIPAGVGIGTEEDGINHMLVFHSGSGALFVGRPLNLRFGEVTQVAVVMGAGNM
ncbi:MAG: hypothetical protein HY986_14100 [Candidatus Melainabacteria bacterium]|nr:hypothetical protein [Candidatus Melainabacteria bacterium]